MWTRAFLTAALAGAFVVAPAVGQMTGAGHSAEGDDARMDIVGTAAAAGSFETLVAAVKAAGLVETLRGEGPFTVFAPTDEAFGALPEGTVESLLEPENLEKLRAVLTYHVVPGERTAEDVLKAESLETVQGGSLEVRMDEGTPRIGGARIVRTDILATNGVIHVIDAVLLPPEAAR